MIELITASAGSGKTYTLAKKYIGILLDAYVKEGSGNTRQFEHILAVTFTNKATAEMKDRILQELYILSYDPALSDYYGDFCKTHGSKVVSDPDVWRRILNTLLHNYSRFSVSTIDTFFQYVLRHFAREIGSFNSYRIELDRDSLVSEAADNLLSDIVSTDDLVFKIVSGITSDKIGEGRKFNPKEDLTQIARQLMNGEFIRALESIRTGQAYDDFQKDMKTGTTEFSGRVDTLEKALSDDLDITVGSLGKASVDLCTCLQKHKAVIDGRKKLAGSVEKFSCNVRTADLSSSAVEHLSRYDFFKDGQDTGAAMADLEAVCPVFLGLYNRRKRVCEILKYIPHLKFTVSVFREFAKVTDNANVKCLEDTTKLLSQIIAGSDTPFIYEKIGTRYDSYLLDEFQDTSHVQWENFRPLLDDANSKGGKNLVVGDVKQSIYRFRNSDYTILADTVPGDFAGDIHKTPLNSNYRSGRNIVEFNNDLFAALARRLDGKEEINGNVLQDIYLLKDPSGAYVYPYTVGQEAKKDFDGYVRYERICGADAEDVENKVYGQVVSIVKDLRDRKVRMKDILILVKGKEQGAHIAEDLLKENIGVYSDDSLFIGSNAIARRLLAVLRYMDNAKDSISAAVVAELGEDFSGEGDAMSYSTLVDLCEKVIAKLKHAYGTTEEKRRDFAGSIPYLSSLVDVAAAYENDYGSSLHGFLEYFDRKEAKIASSPSDDSVRIMTIHKSKGLDGEFVIVPFINKLLLFDTHHNKKWSKCDDVPVPTQAKDLVYYASLSGKQEWSAFRKSYLEEYKQRCIDAMNLLYVAFTRAKYGLYAIEGAGGRGSGTLAEEATEYLEGKNDGHLTAKDDGGIVYETGSLDAAVADCNTPREESNRRKKELLEGLGRQERMEGDYCVFESRTAVRNSIKANDFFDGLEEEEGTGASDSKMKGILMHEILSCVRTADDVDNAVEAKWQEGVLDGTREDAKSFLRGRMQAVSQYGWFAPEATVVTEEGMLVRANRLQKAETPVAERMLPGGEMEYIVSRRPDRVVVHPDGSVDIVDYKFTGTAQSNLSAYSRQVKDYCKYYRSLPGCGDKKVTGYIWYVNSSDVVRV